MSDPVTAASAPFITTDKFLEHWQGHRRLSRRMIEAFPEDQLFTFSIGGMRSFGMLALEMLAMATPMVHGTLNDTWPQWGERQAIPKADLLREWDEATAEIDRVWPQIPAERFTAEISAYGQWPGKAYDLLLYTIDNEIHHRGQGYVYLRALGIEPPPFYERT